MPQTVEFTHALAREGMIGTYAVHFHETMFDGEEAVLVLCVTGDARTTEKFVAHLKREQKRFLARGPKGKKSA